MEENYCALAVCILRVCTPEQAFRLIETGKKGKASKHETKSMGEEMYRLHEKGKTWRQIGKLYNISESNAFRLAKAYGNKHQNAV